MSDFMGKVAQAKQRVALATVMQQHGRDPELKRCPFCDDKGSKLFRAKATGEPAFKCFHSDCPTGGKVFDQVSFLQFQYGLATWQEAAIVFIKEAAPELWRDQPSPSLMPGKAGRKAKLPSGEDADERLLRECIEVVRSAQRASVSLLQRRLQIGYTRANRMMDLLEQRGLVGPSNGAEPREIFFEKLPKTETSVSAPENPPHLNPLPQGGEEIETLPVAVADALADASALEAGIEESLPPSDPPVVPDAEGAGKPPHLNPLPQGGEETEKSRITGSSPALSEALPAAPTISSSDKPLADLSAEGKIDLSSLSASPPAAPVESLAPEPPSPAVAALRWFYTRLHLDERDRALLWRKRGLHAPTVEALGYRSNLKTNKDILLEMEEHFPMLVLIDSGLWQQSDRATEPPKPNAQYYGMALVPKLDEKTGKKVRDRDGEPIIDCVWDEPGPILIPYFDSEGDLVHLRPHKGMMRGRTPRFYVARPSREYLAAHPNFRAGTVGAAALPGITMAKPLFGDIEDWLESLHAQYAVITEGEFKAAALWQTLNGLETTLEPPAVRQVIIGYDNEDKGNPALPGYQEDDWKRYDAEVWARYLARQISKEGYEGKVAHLPDAWRDANGKADWDGRLSARLQELQVTDFVGWKKNHAALRADFESCLKKAMPVRELWQADFYDNDEERIIKNRLEAIAWERKLPIGGDDETNMARRLQRIVPRLKRTEAIPEKDANFLYLLAKHYQEVAGGYYNFKKPTEKFTEKWLGHLMKASMNSDSDLKRACEIVLLGIPTRVSDFFMKAQNVLVKTTGQRIRLVALHNIHGVKSILCKLPAEAFAQPSKFREWLLNNISGATWCAGERELQALQMDIARELAHKEIMEVAVRGYHAESKCWFFGDVVYTPDGLEIFDEKSNVKAGKWDRQDNIWIKGSGRVTQAYKLSEFDHEGQEFCQGTPRLHPKTVVADAELKDFFIEVTNNFYQTLGDYTAQLSLGTLFACGAGAEIYEAFTGMPGLWVHGETRQGKSSVVRWLMKIWGFNIDKGLPLADSTKVGLSIALQQYGELIVWLEEFQPGSAQWLVEKIKNVHNRESGIKKTFDEGRRKILSTAIVTGVATCTDAQVKSRFVHVQVAAKNRKADLYQWFQQNSGRFYLFGRHIMRHRKQFAERTLAIMRGWMDEDMPGVDGRARLVYGASYAAFVAFNELVGSPFGEHMLTGLKNFAITHAVESVKLVNEQVNLNIVWRLMLDANRSGAFGFTPGERKRVFKWVDVPGDKSPVSEHQTAIGADYPQYRFPTGRLYFKPGAVLDMLQKHLRQRGKDLPLDQADLHSQMKTRDYYVPPKNKERGHAQTFGEGSKVKEYCWCIDPVHHELGLLAQPDEEFDASLHPEPTAEQPDTSFIWIQTEKWVDPRKGDLFALIQSLTALKNGGDDEKDFYGAD